MTFVSTKKIPNQKESLHWVDLNENPYGGIIKYYDDHIDEWVYLNEPRFELSAASKLTYKQLDVLSRIDDFPIQIDSLQKQVDNLDEVKADKSEVLTEEDAKIIHDELKKQIDELHDKFVTNDGELSARVEEVNDNLTADIEHLTTTMNNTDAELRSSIQSKASYEYVGRQIQSLTGVAPDVLNTLEELAAALGNDPNFATTVTEMIADKTTRDDVVEIVNLLVEDNLFNETDPTVPQWAKQSTKPSYTASEIGALPASTVIPELTSLLTNDAGFLTQLEVNALIQANKPLNTEQYAKINKLDSYIVYNITEGSINLPTEYAIIVVNVHADITELNVFFDKEPIVGSRFRLYINPMASVSTNFHTLLNEVLHTTKVSTVTRFDITAIDLTDYPLTTEANEILTTENGSTIVVNILDGYIIDYVNMLNDLTWYEGE